MTTEAIDQKVRQLQAEIPRLDPASDPVDQIRAALHPLLDAIQDPALAEPVILPVDPNSCPNCGCPASSTRSPYCGDACREESAFVRQFRVSLAGGTLFDPERQRGTGQALWHLVIGGYPQRQTLVPKRTVAKVIERHEGKCAVCGEPATEIDHTGSG